MLIRVDDNEALLARASQDMNAKWENTASVWRDKARDDFDRKHLEELRQAVHAARQAMKAVDAILRQAIQDCG
jgi:hypothetical protein